MRDIAGLRPIATLVGVVAAITAFTGCAAEQATQAGALKECGDCPEMVLIAPGEFDMGRDGGEPGRYDGPVRTVTIAQPYYLSATEVTQAQFGKFVDATGHVPVDGCNVFANGKWGWADWADWQNPGLPDAPKPSDPVVCVSWDDATAYVGWLAETTGQPYRLPTEAEWEFAARAGTQSEFAWEGSAEGGCEMANMFDAQGRQGLPDAPWPEAACDDGHPAESPVASMKPNALGLYDILGNVWEWTQDCYVLPYPGDAPSDGSSVEVEGECERRTVRGGSWETRPTRLVPAFRGRDAPAAGFRTFGIRVARSA
ncbi:MAG: formylglycine-generating enzyme family protein [Pseudomonadota bacterium]